MYRSSNETHLARIASLEQQLVEAREALASAGVEPPLSPEEQDQRIATAGRHFLLLSGGIFLLLVIAVAFRCVEPEEPAVAYPPITLENLPPSAFGPAPAGSAHPDPARVTFEVP